MTSERAARMHAMACELQRDGYMDPDSGLFVLTAFFLQKRGFCCGKGCRHCPYDTAEQKRAGRPGS